MTTPEIAHDHGADTETCGCARLGLIRFDDEGRIAEFEVMVRPMSGLQALGEEMGRRVGTTLPAFKVQGA